MRGKPKRGEIATGEWEPRSDPVRRGRARLIIGQRRYHGCGGRVKENSTGAENRLETIRGQTGGSTGERDEHVPPHSLA